MDSEPYMLAYSLTDLEAVDNLLKDEEEPQKRREEEEKTQRREDEEKTQKRREGGAADEGG